MQAPRILPRVVPCRPNCVAADTASSSCRPSSTPTSGKLFPGMNVAYATQFRLTRDSDLTVDEEDLQNLRAAIQNELHDREYGDGVRPKSSTPVPPTSATFCSRNSN